MFKILKELFPYKQYGGKYHFRYYVFFCQRGNTKTLNYFDYDAGRCEVRVDEEQYSIDEFRYLTKKKIILDFRDYIECKYF